MIKLELTSDEAINLLLILNRECQMYTTGGAAPKRIVDLRSVVSKIDSRLDELHGYDTTGK